MEETQNRATAARNSSSSRFGIRGGTATGGGEIVEVQGGHIVRSTGRKDRHSKVCTAKGPRDRRVRLSAHTAIQFYDVQDRLGYDRPSKAVDWLIKKAKAAIDELDELPPWNPAETLAAANSRGRRSVKTKVEREGEGEGGGNDEFHFGQRGNLVGSSSDIVVHENLQSIENLNDENPNSNFLPPSLDSDSIADTIKSFFPMGAASTDHNHHTPSSSLQFQSFPPDLLSRTTSHTQDLRLSLQSFQEPNSLLHHHHHHHHLPAHSQVQQNQNEQFQVYFSGATPLGFDTSESEISRFQRMIAWNGNSDDGNNGIGTSGAGATGGGGGFMFNSQPPQQPPQQPLLFGQSQYFNSQRGPLQSRNSPPVRAWIDQPIGLTSNDHHHHHHQILPPNFHHPMISSVGPSMGGFSGFHIPARIQGENEDQHDGIHHNKPSSASSDSCH